MARCVMCVGLLCILIGYWGPWASHPAAGLIQNGFDLSEFVKFMPQVRDGGERVAPWLFFLPLSALALSLSLLAGMAWARRRLGPCLLGSLMALGLLVMLVPPYPYTSDRLWGAGFRPRTELALWSWGGALVLALSGRWVRGLWANCALMALVLAGVAAPLAQFLSLRDALSAVYGRPVAVGWGPWLMAVGMAILLGVTAQQLRR